MAEQGKRIVCFDFDGVLHSYVSGWKGPRVIPDRPVPGALRALAALVEDPRLSVCILSSRSHAWGGRRAMKRWLVHHFCALAPDWENTPTWLRRIIARTAFADPWEDEVRWAVKCLVNKIAFPKHKPPAHVTIDDRALQFCGIFPSADALLQFKPWRVNLESAPILVGVAGDEECEVRK